MSWVKDFKKKFQFQTSNTVNSQGNQIYGQEDDIIEIEVQIQKLILTHDEIYFLKVLDALQQFYSKDEVKIKNLQEFFFVLADKTNSGLLLCQSLQPDKNLVASLNCMMWLSKFSNLNAILVTELPHQLFEFKAFMSKLKVDDKIDQEFNSYLITLDQLTTLYLSQLLLKQEFLLDSIKKDYLFNIFDTFLHYPSESLKDLINIIIRHADQNSLLTYLNQKSLIFHCCEFLNKWIESDQETNLLWLLQIISSVLEEDVQQTHNLEKQFFVFGGYSLLTQLLLNTNFQWELKYYLISILENLVFSGKQQFNNPTPAYAAENSFGPNITNFSPLAPLLFVLLTPNIDPAKVSLSENLMGNTTNLPDQFKQRILNILCNLAQLSPNNFNILNSHLLLLKLIENFSSISFEMKESTMKLLIYAVNNFEYKPIKELSLFYFVIRELESDFDGLKLVFNSITQLLNNKNLHSISLEVGLLHNLNELFSQILARIKIYKSEYPEDEEIDLTKLRDIPDSSSKPIELEIYLRTFPFLCSSLSAHLLDDITVLNRFKHNFQDGLLELLRYPITKAPCLMLLETLFVVTSQDSPDFNRLNLRLFEQLLEFLQLKLNVAMKLTLLRFLKKILYQNELAQTHFTKSGGFICLISFLVNMKETQFTEDRLDNDLALLHEISSVLFTALQANPFTQYYFLSKVGLDLFEEGFLLTGVLDQADLLKFAFGLLFGLIMGDERLITHFQNSEQIGSEADMDLTHLLFGTMQSPWFISTLFRFSSKLHPVSKLEYDVLKSVFTVVHSSLRNQILFSQQKVGNYVLLWLNDLNGRKLEFPESKEMLLSLLHCLFEFGTNDIDVHKLIAPLQDNEIPDMQHLNPLEIVQLGIQSSTIPPIFHFDAQLEDSSLTVRGISRSLGIGLNYSMLLWIQIVQFPESDQLPILMIMDDQDKQLYELSINPLRLITIRGPSGASVSFDGTVLKEEVWYHLAIVQSKVLLSMSSGSVHLYINGRPIDQRKYSYGVSDSSNTTCSIVVGSLHATGGVFNLASINVIDESLDAISIDRIYKLGIQYRSTFQDSNRVVATNSNESSFELFRNNSIASIRSRESKHSDPIVTNLSNHFFIAEDKLIVSLHPRYQIDTFQTNTSIMVDKPRFGFINLRFKQPKYTLSYYDGLAYPSQQLITSNHYHITAQLWKIGGCGMLLKWIDQATQAPHLELSLSILTYAVISDGNFREEMDRIHGYEILGFLLKRKATLASPSMIDILLCLLNLGVSLDHPCLNNLPAFKHVILDFDIWKLANLQVQQAIIDSFTKLIVHNLSAKTNLEIMNSYDTIKRLLFSLKFDQLHRSLLTSIIQVLKLILSSNYCQDNIRLLVAFVTSILSRDVSLKPQSPRFAKSKFYLDRGTVVEDARTAVPPIHHLFVGNSILEMLLQLLQDPTYAVRITSMVTSKWILLLFTNEHNPYSIVLATRIVARLLYVNGSAFATKFRIQHEGFVILHKILPKWWFLPQLYQAVIAILLGVDIANLPINCKLDFYSLVSLFDKDANSDKEVSAEATSILFLMVKHCLGSFHSQSQHPNLDGRMSRTTSVNTLREESTSSTSITIPSLKESDKQVKLNKISQMIQTLLQFTTELFHVSKTFRNIVNTNPVLETLSAIGFPLSHNFIDLMRAPSQFDPDTSVTTPTSSSANSVVSPVLSPRSTTSKHRRSLTLPEKNVIDLPVPRTEAVESFLEFLLVVCTTSILESSAKNLHELEQVLKAPFQADFDAYVKFTNYFLSHLLRHLLSTLQLNPQLLLESRALVGTVKFTQLMVDLCYQGFFTSGRFLIFEFITTVLDRLKEFQLSSAEMRFDTSTVQMLKFLNRIVLYNFTEATSNLLELRFTIKFLKSFIVQHENTMHPKNTDVTFWRVVAFHLFELLSMDKRTIQINAFNIWKLVLLFKPNEIQTIFKSKDSYQQSILDTFLKNLEMDLDTFVLWLESSRSQIVPVLDEILKKPWDAMKQQEIRQVGEVVATTHHNLELRFENFHLQKESDLKAYQRVLTILHTWSRNLVNLENESYSKIVQDQNDSNGMVIRLWYQTLLASASNVEKDPDELRWKLDLTEGPYRMRKRMKPNRHVNTVFSYTPKYSKSVLEVEGTSTIQVDEDTLVDNDIQDGGDDLGDEDDTSSLVTELNTDSKGYRVLRYLEPNEEILEIFNIGRVTGLDLADSLLLFCKSNIYVIDGYFLCQDGNIVESNEIPERDVYLQLLTSTSTNSNKEASSSIVDHQCRKCSYTDLKEVHKRKFLFRNAALEIFFSDGRNLLLTTVLDQREAIYSRFTAKLAAIKQPHEMIAGTSSDLDSTNVALSSRITNMIFGSSSLTELTSRWEKREITNFEYLMYLNTLAGRSYNDLTQYPVFPWILSDYYSSNLDLTNPATFRDLSKPMGAQSEARAREFQSRFQSFKESDEQVPPFHYGTHYSSAMIVCWYLIRLEPFTTHHLKLQGGHFDHPDRLFFSVKEAWLSAAFHNTTDVRELIPEFFYLEEFLENSNKYDFGSKQESGEAINSVQLPPWAHSDYKLFVKKHREALECDYVSQHLHLWIDLIFGYKQQGPEAIEALNVFHHLSYQDAVDLDAILDPIEKAATIGIIHNFGQTPKQLFRKPHPQRPAFHKEFRFDLRFDAKFLIQSYLPVLDVNNQVNDILQANNKLMALGGSRRFVPKTGAQHLEWNLTDHSIRIYQTDPKKLMAVFEESHLGKITTVEPYDPTTFLTAGDDNLVKVWNLKMNRNFPDIRLKSIFRGIVDDVTTITSNQPFGIVVVGTKGFNLQVWDLNRSKYLRTLTLPQPHTVAIACDRSNGTVTTITPTSITIFTVNGVLLTSLQLNKSEPKFRTVFYLEPKPGEFHLKDCWVTGHDLGVVKFWSLEPPSVTLAVKNWTLKLIHQLQLKPTSTSNHEDMNRAVTTIRVSTTRQTLYLGDSKGLISSYQFPDTADDLHRTIESTANSHSTRCCNCETGLGNSNNSRWYCNPCGGLVCAKCRRDNPFSRLNEVLYICEGCLRKFDEV